MDSTLGLPSTLLRVTICCTCQWVDKYHIQITIYRYLNECYLFSIVKMSLQMVNKIL